MADPTRLELATSAVTGQRSNQLSYESNMNILYTTFPKNTSHQKHYVCYNENVLLLYAELFICVAVNNGTA